MSSQQERDSREPQSMSVPGADDNLESPLRTSEGDPGASVLPVFPIFDRHGEVARVIPARAPGVGMSAESTAANRYRAARTGSEEYGFYGMIGSDPKMEALFRMVRVVAESDATVLILGESGTGKELVARAIHRISPRRARPFVAINCGAFPEALLESELFGHIRGSFTGAVQNKKGLIEEADGGTLFLDEIGDSSPVFQSKLLRVLQEGLVRPVGGTRNLSINVRVIAATNKSLQEAVRLKMFREDLYYRLSVIPIVIPPLRERREDIGPLAEHFVAKYKVKNRREGLEVSTKTLDCLRDYSWPGNVRELENVIERAVVISKGPEIQPEELLIDEHSKVVPRMVSASQPRNTGPCLASVERERIIDALRRYSGNRSKSARELGISRTGLYYKMKRYRITPLY